MDRIIFRRYRTLLLLSGGLTLCSLALLSNALRSAGVVFTKYRLVATLTSLLMVAGFLLWWRLTRSLFSLFGLFLIASILFNGGQIILAAFGLSPSAIVGGRFTGQVFASLTGWIVI